MNFEIQNTMHNWQIMQSKVSIPAFKISADFWNVWIS